MLTFKQIEALYWTVRLGTFAASAQKLHTTQSAITKRIQELEADFDIALFDRSGYRAELTARGHEIYALAEEMLGHRDRLLVRLKGQHTLTGTFRFGITEITAMTWLPALIRLLRSHYPRITLEPHIDLGADLLSACRPDSWTWLSCMESSPNPAWRWRRCSGWNSPGWAAPT